MQCLWCGQFIIQELSWGSLILPKRKSLCEECNLRLIQLEDKRCLKCSKNCKAALCTDCSNWKAHQNTLQFNYSIFTYNEMMQKMVSRWKYRGDAYLGNAFRGDMVYSFKKRFNFIKKHAVIVPIPISRDRLSERGFNQAEMLAGFLPMKIMPALERKDSEKQSKKTRKQRINTTNPFSLKIAINKPVILVDDIYTTGSTLRHASNKLTEYGCPEVYAFTLIRG
ncbi:hypothetical protein M948_02770 [Virgibacillus sp. CM-4]|uniref:ComF family protein n=1 Tax=Virgibacillus sp. CM-4 TaxID=1354277 RepID=UPI0003882BBB|nr:ComF family protein [Virgibacillus sp. CM-4]EQB37485.1 hypothetical protein M948_02770 [Virgibacillus sp. CM-4]